MDKSAVFAASVAIRRRSPKIVQQADGRYSAFTRKLEQTVRVQTLAKIWRQIQ
jgi:hypothetical protein